MGRPHSRTELQEKEIFKILELGLSERTACEFAEVKWSTYMSWKDREEKFATKIAQKKAKAKVNVATRLYREIFGEKDEDGKWIRQPNTTAMIFWLKTRAKEEFTESQDININELPKGFETRRI